MLSKDLLQICKVLSVTPFAWDEGGGSDTGLGREEEEEDDDEIQVLKSDYNTVSCQTHSVLSFCLLVVLSEDFPLHEMHSQQHSPDNRLALSLNCFAVDRAMSSLPHFTIFKPVLNSFLS